MTQFERPFDAIDKRDNFGPTEVGLTHPELPSFIKLSDTGAIEIFPKEGFGIILDPGSGSINFFADSVRFFTKANDGIRWNELSFNPKATNYTEPALVSYENEDTLSIFRGVDELLTEE